MAVAWRRCLFTALAILALTKNVIAAKSDEDEEVRVLLEMADKDGNGKLTFNEVLMAGEEEGAEHDAEFHSELTKHFQASDANGDGLLTGDEIPALLKLFNDDHSGEL
mmetsp:Transcript_47350/g.136245  ORF Transcript_47350/g.136245 Transcript_47350/m.136245 type:complete len:108 (-) Transcript_47350:90-413(-)